MSTLDTHTTHLLLNKYVNTDIRNMMTPFTQDTKLGRCLCSTNSHIIILVPETEENKLPEDTYENILPPHVDKVIPELKDPTPFYFQHFLNLYSNVSLITREVTRECESCKGEGNFEHYGNQYDCKECDETGKTKTGEKETIPNPNAILRFQTCDIPINHFKTLIDICRIVVPSHNGCSIITWNNATIWFKLDEVVVGMALHRINEEDDKENNITREIILIELN